MLVLVLEILELLWVSCFCFLLWDWHLWHKDVT